MYFLYSNTSLSSYLLVSRACFSVKKCIPLFHMYGEPLEKTASAGLALLAGLISGIWTHRWRLFEEVCSKLCRRYGEEDHIAKGCGGNYQQRNTQKTNVFFVSEFPTAELRGTSEQYKDLHSDV